MRIFENTNYDFIRWRWHALALSALVVAGRRRLHGPRGGIPLGIDFTGGTIVVVKFETPVAEDAVRQALAVGARREGRPELRRPGRQLRC